MEKAEIIMMNGGVQHTKLSSISMMAIIVAPTLSKVTRASQLGHADWHGQW